MPNDECQMKSEFQITNNEGNQRLDPRNILTVRARPLSTFEFRISNLFRISDFGFRASFVIRHSSFVIFLISLLAIASSPIRAAEPLPALLITGGCCHDYEAQKKILTEGISARANVTWTIIHEGDSNSKTQEFSIYKKDDWTKGFDVVVHNECSGMVTNVAFVEHIAKGHAGGIPAVVIHCSIHSYRNSTTDEWRKVLGIKSMRHQQRRPFDVEAVKSDHPVMKGWSDFTA